ncbi:MAG TPA: helix-turn-helix transcriptional regulator [Mycobacteriales bacterium]|jgi:transcriptional regulator with XRE-family HTH domain|nr:helix-turn-helix transcriptional regulator [Mycobacteriales bacterium]
MESASARERRLAHELKLWRSAAQLHGKDVAARLGWSASKVSRIESSSTGISEPDLDRLLELYEVPPERAAALRALAPSVRPRGWWDAYADTLSSGYASLIRMEAGSRALQCYCAVVPHALLQTPDYAREVIRTTWRQPPQTEVDRRVQVCRRRQDLLDAQRKAPLELSAVVDEVVLRRRPAGVTGEAVLRGQLEHLAEVATWPHVTLQVLPFSAGLPPVTAGSFSVLESAATGAADVVYLENKTRIFVLEKEAEVHGYTREFALLTELALSPDDSLALVRALAGG